MFNPNISKTRDKIFHESAGETQLFWQIHRLKYLSIITAQTVPVKKRRCHIFFLVNFSKTKNAILANVSGLHHWFPREITSGDYRIPMLMTCHYPDLGSASDWSCWNGNLFQPTISTTSVGNDTSSVWDLRAPFAGKKGWCLEVSAVFSGY